MVHHAHDRLIGKLLEDKSIAIDLLKNHLPAHALAKLDLATLQATSETAVSEGWKKFHNDIVFRCKTKNKEEGYIYLLIEHQSTPDRFMPVRLLRYKMNLLGKYLDAKNKPDKLPNIMSLVIYHGAQEYPYAKSFPGCFEDESLAAQDLLSPMWLLDLADMADDVLLQHGGADALLKLLLKHSRKKDFFDKIHTLIRKHRKIFLSLSVDQARFVFGYVLHVGKGNPENAKTMKAAMSQVYGEAQTEKFFSLADYFRQEAVEKAIKEGQRGALKRLLQQGIISEEQAQKTLKELN